MKDYEMINKDENSEDHGSQFCYVFAVKLETYDPNSHFDYLYDDDAWLALKDHNDAKDTMYSSHSWDVLSAYKRVLGIYEPKECFFRINGMPVGALQLVLYDDQLEDIRDYLFNCRCHYVCMRQSPKWNEYVAAWLETEG